MVSQSHPRRGGGPYPDSGPRREHSPAGLNLRGVTVCRHLVIYPPRADWRESASIELVELAIRGMRADPRTASHHLGHLRGSSSPKFSKYLLPKRSVPIRVPALVSPVSSCPGSALGALVWWKRLVCDPYPCSNPPRNLHLSSVSVLNSDRGRSIRRAFPRGR